MLKRFIAKLVERQHLAAGEAEEAMGVIMEGEATPAQIASFLTALRVKGETVEEITGCARAMRAKATPIRAGNRLVVDTCGTGGDGSGTFNISTTAALVVAGAGLTVAKHGNRSVSSRSGSADVLEALGVRLDLEPAEVEECLDRIGIAFLFAPRLHPAMKHALGPRREMGIRTIFNLLGPLTNPAGAQAQVVGVYHPELTETLGRVLQRLGTVRALVVHGLEGLDEISLSGPTRITEVADGQCRTYLLEPEDAGFTRASPGSYAGGDADRNAAITLEILGGEKGPHRDVVLLNAAAALLAGGAVENLREGVALAASSIDSGRAMAKLEALREFTGKARAAG